MRKRIDSVEQIEWIRQNAPTMTTRKLAECFTETFNLPTGQTQIRRMMERNGIKASGKRNDFIPIGTERYSRYYDCMVVKVGDYHCTKGTSKKERDRNRNENWKLKQNLVWETTHGRKLMFRECVIFLDGNRMNYNPDNLYAVKMNVAGTIEKMQMHSEDKDIYKTALMWGELFYLMKKRNKGERQCHSMN